MKLQYLGTAAAEAIPAPFCQCSVCSNARVQGGRNIRTRSQALVDDCILLDFPADTYLHTLRDNLRLYAISACLVTHNHSDHLYPAELECLTSWAAHRKEEKTFHLYGTNSVLCKIREQCPECDRLELDNLLYLHEIKPFEPFIVDGYHITPLEADHGAPESVIYMLEKDGKTILYAHDTGLLPQASMDYLDSARIHLDLVSYDCTNGLLEWDNRGHMGLTGNVILREELTGMGLVSRETLHVINHFSHNGLAGYDELTAVGEKKGFIISYDGMKVKF